MKPIPLLALSASLSMLPAQVPKWRDLFNGKNLQGWVNVNTDPGTWPKMRDPPALPGEIQWQHPCARSRKRLPRNGQRPANEWDISCNNQRQPRCSLDWSGLGDFSR